MTHTFLIELTDEVKGYKDCVDYLERIYGAEEFDFVEHDKQLLEDLNEFLVEEKGEYVGSDIDEFLAIRRGERNERMD